jgi:hypothetical protein
MSRIFISYRRNDDPGYAGRLYDQLSAHFGDDQVFMDLDSVPLGIDFAEYIEQTVETVDALIAVIGPTWLNCTDEEGARRLDQVDDFVRIEIRHALARNIRVVPVLVRGARMPKAEELPEDLQRLARRNALQVTDSEWRAGVKRLIESLQDALGGPAQVTKPAPTSQTGKRRKHVVPQARKPLDTDETVIQAVSVTITTQAFRDAGFPIGHYWSEGLADILVTRRRLIVRPHTGGEVTLNLDEISFSALMYGRIEVYAQDTSKNFYIESPDREFLAALDRLINRQ